MSPHTRSAARMSAEEYCALFKPRGQHMEGVPELADEESWVRGAQEEDVPEDEEMQDPTPLQPAQLANIWMGWTLVVCGN